MSTLLLKNCRAVVSCNAADDVFTDCDILVKDGFIAELGSNLDDSLINGVDDEVIDCRQYAIYPGLINTHHHFFQTFVRNQMSIDYPAMTVIEWLDKIYRIFQNFDEEMIFYSSATALADLVKHGCTTAFDHQYCYTKRTGKNLIDHQVKAASRLGVRYVGGRGTNTLPRDKGSTIPDAMLETTDEFISDCERLIHRYHEAEPGAMCQIVVAPCQPINAYKETFVESIKLARKHKVRLHTHLGEGENEGMVARYGKRTLDWCEEIGFIGEDTWFAHCWELLPEEYARLGKFGSGISHCPTPAVLGGFPLLDFARLAEQNVILSLGCDGSATNDSSNPLDALRLAYLMQAWHSKERGGSVTPYDVLKIATVGGAKTLGRPELGSLGPGQAADLFAVDLSRLELVGCTHDPKNMLAKVAYTGYVHFTMVHGRIVAKEGELCLTDEAELTAAAAKVQARLNRYF